MLSKNGSKQVTHSLCNLHICNSGSARQPLSFARPSAMGRGSARVTAVPPKFQTADSWHPGDNLRLHARLGEVAVVSNVQANA